MCSHVQHVCCTSLAVCLARLGRTGRLQINGMTSHPAILLHLGPLGVAAVVEDAVEVGEAAVVVEGVAVASGLPLLHSPDTSTSSSCGLF